MNWLQQTPCLGRWALNVKVWLLHLRPSRRSFHVQVLKGTKQFLSPSITQMGNASWTLMIKVKLYDLFDWLSCWIIVTET